MFNQYFGNPFYGNNSNYIQKDTAYPQVINIDKETLNNKKFKTILWKGTNFQVTLMCINPGENMGLEANVTDKFIRIEEGFGVCVMGTSKNNLNLRKNIYDGYAVMIPKNIWLDIINLGKKPIKLYIITETNKKELNKKQDIKEH